MGHHSVCMDPLVGSTRSMDSIHRRKKAAKDFLDSLLNGVLSFLSLPAVVIGPVVGDGQFNLNQIR